MICLSRSYHFKFFNGCLLKILLGPFLNTLTELMLLLFFKKVMTPFMDRAQVINNWGALGWMWFKSLLIRATSTRSRYSRMDQVTFVEDFLSKFWINMICFSRLYHFKFFKDCLPQILLSPSLNTLTKLMLPCDPLYR